MVGGGDELAGDWSLDWGYEFLPFFLRDPLYHFCWDLAREMVNPVGFRLLDWKIKVTIKVCFGTPCKPFGFQFLYKKIKICLGKPGTVLLRFSSWNRDPASEWETNEVPTYTKFIYSEKATKFCEFITLLLTGTI